MKQRFRIDVWYEPPPIPTDAFNWHAQVDGGDETKCGHGKTAAEAVEDLLQSDRRFEE